MTPLMPMGLRTHDFDIDFKREVFWEPERLRELLDGNIPATLAFHDRMLDLDRRYEAFRQRLSAMRG